MRPLPGDDAFAGRSRTTSFTDNDITPLATRSQPPQMTYFLTDEKSIGDSQSSSPTIHPKHRDTIKNSSYGVESLETSISSIAQDSDDQDDKVRNARRNWKKKLAHNISTNSDEDMADFGSPSSNDLSRNTSPSYQRRSSQATISRPFTPLSFGSPAPPSLIGSPVSRRNSDAGSYMDDNASQAIMSSGDEERETSLELMDSGSAPQLVMPSIKMPSRRPFTERGKNLGRLKVLIAGDSGVGKSSLIKAIVQTCEDIVHVDPLSTTPIAIPDARRKSSRSKSRSGNPDLQPTSQITEVYASTKAYPAWWSDLEESRILRRRKSLGDSVLERNLCFVDTPGYGNKTSCLESITPVVDYVESQLQKAANMRDMSDSDMINLLSGNGGTQVDLVFYVFAQRVKPVDIEYLRRLSHLTNIIPIILRADTMSAEQLASLKENIMSEMQTNNIRPFVFGLGSGDAHEPPPSAPYAISAQPSKDEDTMDASLLMSPDYIQPLVPSELSFLVTQVFSRDTISWLRYSAAKKFVQWRTSDPVSRPQSLYRPLSQSKSLIPSSSQILTAPIGATTSYALARITDHTQREERIAQVRLANWAADLQRSLQNERNRFESLARSERAVWLTERLGECVQDGTIVPLSQARQTSFAGDSGTLVKAGTYSRKKNAEIGSYREGVNPHDPLGLLQLNEDMKKRAWFALQLVGGMGFFGGLAYFFTRTFQGDASSGKSILEWPGTFQPW